MDQFSQEAQVSKDSALVQVESETQAIVEQSPLGPSPEGETEALLDALRKRAQAEVQAAQTLTQETYIAAVRQAREAVEQTQLVDPDEIEAAAEQIMQDAQQNWQSVLAEIQSFGDRLSEAAQAAWDVLTRPKA